MSWTKNHEVSERLASQAQAALREGRQREALDLYARAAHAEELAVADMDTAKVRTLGISAVSAVSLYYKAAKFERAEEVAAHWLGSNPLPAFAREQLRSLLQSIWSEQTRNNADVRFAQGQVLVSVQGGEVVSGGAPLDLIMDKVKTVQSLFHRTADSGPPDSWAAGNIAGAALQVRTFRTAAVRGCSRARPVAISLRSPFKRSTSRTSSRQYRRPKTLRNASCGSFVSRLRIPKRALRKLFPIPITEARS